MPSTARPAAQGGSHLYVTIANECVSYVLADTDPYTGLCAVDHIAIPAGTSVHPDNLDYFLGQTLKAWSNEIGWKLMECDDDLCMLSLCEGECVDGASLFVDKAFSDEPFSSLVLGTDAVVIKDQQRIDTAARICDVFNASSAIQVIADWDSVRVYTVAPGTHARSDGKMVVKEMAIESQTMDQVQAKTMQSLLGVSMRRDDLIDGIYNIRARKVGSIFSNTGADIIRAYLTGMLFNMRDPVLQTFGSNSPEPVLLITGEIARALPLSYLILAVIDGLQLRGRYTVAVDKRNASLPGAVAVSKGITPIPVTEIYPTRYLYVSTERDASGREGQTAFRGYIRKDSEGDYEEELVIGQTGKIYTNAVKEAGRLMIQPSRNAYFPNLRKEKIDGKNYLVADISGTHDGVIMDCRKIPVVYGPDPQANQGKIREWIQGLPEFPDE